MVPENSPASRPHRQCPSSLLCAGWVPDYVLFESNPFETCLKMRHLHSIPSKDENGEILPRPSLGAKFRDENNMVIKKEEERALPFIGECHLPMQRRSECREVGVLGGGQGSAPGLPSTRPWGLFPRLSSRRVVCSLPHSLPVWGPSRRPPPLLPWAQHPPEASAGNRDLWVVCSEEGVGSLPFRFGPVMQVGHQPSAVGM